MFTSPEKIRKKRGMLAPRRIKVFLLLTDNRLAKNAIPACEVAKILNCTVSNVQKIAKNLSIPCDFCSSKHKRKLLVLNILDWRKTFLVSDNQFFDRFF